jgi:hypothetical protein
MGKNFIIGPLPRVTKEHWERIEAAARDVGKRRHERPNREIDLENVAQLSYCVSRRVESVHNESNEKS